MSYRTVDHHHPFPSLTHSYHSFQYGQTPLSIAQRLGYVSVVETLKTVTETTVITETTVPQEERYKPQNPEAMNETMFSESEDEGLLKLLKFLEGSENLGAVAEHEAATAAAHAKDFSDNLTKGLADSTAVHMIHTGEQLLSRSAELEGKRLSTAAADGPDNLEELIRRAQVRSMNFLFIIDPIDLGPTSHFRLSHPRVLSRPFHQRRQHSHWTTCRSTKVIFAKHRNYIESKECILLNFFCSKLQHKT